MDSSIPGTIVTQNGVKGIIGSKDLRRLFFDVSEYTDKIIDPIPQTWKQKRRESFQIDQMHREITSNILSDPNLSQSYGNPEWYPPVPKYRKPKGKKYTVSEIIRKQMTQDIIFIEENIVVGNIPLSSEDINEEFMSLSLMNPKILSRTIIYEDCVDIITGLVQTPYLTAPEVTNCVGYMVNIYIDPKTHKEYLSHIYAYKNNMVIKELLVFLENMKVENIADLTNTREFFIHMLGNK